LLSLQQGFFFFSSRRRHTRFSRDWSSDVCSSDLYSDEFARTFSLPYSSIESAPDRLGRMAVRELVRRIEGQAGADEPHVVRLVSPELVDRGSTATPPEV